MDRPPRRLVRAPSATLDKLVSETRYAAAGSNEEREAALALARQANPDLTLREIAWTHGRRVSERMGPLWEGL